MDLDLKIRNKLAWGAAINRGILDPMPKGYRGVILAAFGWLALAASPPSNSAKSDQRHRDLTVARSLAMIAKAPSKSIQPLPLTERDRPCAVGEQDRKSELCAEWQAVDQTKEASRWAARSFWVGLAGIFGLLASLYYTRKAVRIANDATKDADNALAVAARNADAAVRLVEVSERNARAQLRAYLSVQKIGLVRRPDLDNEGKATFRLNFSLKNIGKTQASNVKVSYNIIWFELIIWM